MFLRRTIATFAVISLVISPLTPLASAVAASKKPGKEKTEQKAKPALTLATPAPVDWSAVDWDKPVTLAADALVAQTAAVIGKREAAPTHRLSDEDMLQKLNVPEDIRELVRQHVARREALVKSGASPEMLVAQAQALSSQILVNHPGAGRTSAEEVNILDIRNSKKIPNNKLRPASGRPTAKVIKSQTSNPPAPKLFDITGEGLRQKRRPLPRADKKTTFAPLEWLRAFIVGEPATAATPLINYYEGIEKKPLDYALYYLSNQQNEDGSFGQADHYVTTFYAVLALAEVGRNTSDQYGAAVDYLTDTAPRNNRERALKARLLWLLQQQYQPLLDTIDATRNADGGYGYDAGYASDVLTTDEVALTAYLAGYSLQDALPKAVAYIFNNIGQDGSMQYSPNGNASYYLINRTLQTLQPMSSLVVANGQQQVSVQSKIDALLLFLKDNFEGETTSLLGASRTIDNLLTARSWRLFSTQTSSVAALLPMAAQSQLADGSFENSVEATATALVALKAPDAVMVSLVNVGNLQNKASAVFDLTIKNNGYDTLTTSTIWGFVDNYQEEWGLLSPGGIDCIKPGGSFTMRITINTTGSMIGSTNIKFYIEDLSDSNFDDNWVDKTFTFAAAQDASPALPTFFVATQASINGVPGVALKWGPKVDANRRNYVIMSRVKGTPDWNFATLDNKWDGGTLLYPADEGQTYEITIGSLYKNQDLVYFINQPQVVKTSSDLTKYTGTVVGSVADGAMLLAGVKVNGSSFETSTSEFGAFVSSPVTNGSAVAYLPAQQYDQLLTDFPVPVEGTSTVRVFSHLKFDSTIPTVVDFKIREKQNFIIKNNKTVVLGADGADNVAVKEGLFYLWDPAAQYWQFLGSAPPTNGNSEINLKWDVPGDLLGQGYKVKVVVYDYRGNASAPKEWGPFQILDGAAPVFHISAPVLGDNWLLNTTNTIAWTTSSTNPVNKVSLRLVYPNTVEFVASNINNTGSFAFKVPGSALYLGNPVQISVRGTDSMNGEEGTSYSDTFSITDGSPAPAAPWSVASGLFGDAGSVSSAQIIRDSIKTAVTGNGDMHVVYRLLIDNQAVNPRTIKQQLVERVRSGGVWSAPKIIFEDNYTAIDDSFTGFFPLSNLKLASGGQNKLHLVAIKNTAGAGCAPFNGQEIVYIHFDGVAWSAPQNISNTNTASFSPDIAVDQNGNPIVTWLDGRSWNNMCQVSGLVQASVIKKQNGVWGAPTILGGGNPVTDPRLTLGANNTAHLIYRSANTVYETHSAGNNWSAPQEVFTASDLDTSALAADANGHLHVAIAQLYTTFQNQPSERVLYTTNASGAWVTPTTTSPAPINGDMFRYPKLLVDSHNRPVVVYERINDNIGKHQLWWNFAPVPGRWLAPQLLTPAGHYFNETQTAVAANGDSFMAAWLSNYSFSTEPFVSTADFSKDFITPDPVASLAVTSTLSRVLIDWPAYENAFGDLDHFAVYRSNNPISTVAGLQPIGAVSAATSTRFIDNTGTPLATYYYALSAVDAAGNESAATSTEPVLYPKFNGVVYEDAEDKTTANWRLLGAPNSTIENISEGWPHGQAIEIKNSDIYNQNYVLLINGQNNWHNTKAKTLQFDLKTQTETFIYALVETQNQNYYLMYSFNYPTGLRFGRYVSIHLDPSFKDGQWHTVTRDLQADLATLVPNTPITAVEQFLFGSGNARVDNVALREDTVTHAITGKVLDTNNQPLAGIKVLGNPGNNTALTDGSGAYVMGGLIDGNYTIAPQHAEYAFAPTSTLVQIAGSDEVINFVGSALEQYIYEDAEDGSVNRWHADLGGQQGSIANVFDIDANNRAIEVKLTDINNQSYTLLSADGKTNWHNTKAKTLKFDLKTNAEVYAYARVETQNKSYYLMYSFAYPTGIRFDKYISIRLDPSLKDGAWHSVTRDLQADLASLVPNTPIISVEHFIAESFDARFDNILLTNKKTVFSIAGTVTDNNNEPVAGLTLRAAPGQATATTDQNGRYALSGLNNGTYTITADPFSDFELNAMPVTVVVNNDDVAKDLSVKARAKYIYEDAEDGSVGRWRLLGSNLPGTSIAAIANDAQQDKVIEIKTPDINNQNYVLFSSDGKSDWHNTKAKTLQFDLKTNNEAYAYVRVETQNKTYYLMYSFGFPTGLRWDKYASIRLDPAIKDGQWHTITRDLQVDLNSLVPNATIVSVEQFLLGSPSARLDNVMLRTDVVTHKISGAITDAQNQPVAGVTLKASPGNATVVTDQNGLYEIPGLANNTYSLIPQHSDYIFTPTSTIIVVADGDVVKNFAATTNTLYIYEDAEDSSVGRWQLSGVNLPGTSITNNADDPQHGRAIHIQTPDRYNQNYVLFSSDGKTDWHNTKARTLTFDLKTQSESFIYARIETQNQYYYVWYSFGYPTGLLYNRYASINLDPSLKDGQWHTVTRDIAADFAALVPNTPILSIEHFIVGSQDAFIDNVALLR